VPAAAYKSSVNESCRSSHMNILYGVQATGNGHICRSREVIRHLKALNHDVHVIFSGRDPSQLSELKGFEPYQIMHGLTFQTCRGRLNLFETTLRLHLLRFYNEIRSADASDFDLVITDFEPITARLARRHSIPSVGIGHQYAFSYPIPLGGSYPLSRWVIRNFAPADQAVGLHWHHFGYPILPPIVPDYLNAHAEVIPNKILLYLPFEHPNDVEALLTDFRSHHFYIYGVGTIVRPMDRNHLHFRPYSRTGFLNDLAECSGVISNAGFELTSEALQLGKKLLVKPLVGQMEQMSNALAVSRLKLGIVMPALSPSHVGRWLNCPDAPSMGYPDVARLVAEWIDGGAWERIDSLATTAWKQTENIPLNPGA